jgi:hypothetical protein
MTARRPEQALQRALFRHLAVRPVPWVLKAEGGRLSEAQRRAHDALRDAGAEVAVARVG